jgi:ankyrin repeat protein
MNFWNNLILGKKGRFMNSALEGDLTEVKAMLAAGVNVNAKRDDANVTALILASQNGHLEVVQFLLDAGADVNVETNDGATALMVAAHNCHLEVVQALECSMARQHQCWHLIMATKRSVNSSMKQAKELKISSTQYARVM